jgi:hypothetical protein
LLSLKQTPGQKAAGQSLPGDQIIDLRFRHCEWTWLRASSLALAVIKNPKNSYVAESADAAESVQG